MHIKNLKYKTSLILCLSVLLFTGCADENQGLSLGTTKKQVYKNNYFGIEFEFPKEMTQISYEEMDKNNVASGFITPEQASASKTPDELARLETIGLINLEQFPGSKERNTTFAIIASDTQKLLESMKKNEDYVFDENDNIDATFWAKQTKKRLEKAIPEDKRTISELSDVKFGNVTFKRISIIIKLSDTYTLQQDFYTTEIKGYFISVTASTNDGKIGSDILMSILDTLKFS